VNPLKFVEIAKSVSHLSKDPSTKVGAVVLDDHGTILSVGYNGFPRGVVDSPERYENRELKYKLIAHAEANAIAQAARVGATLYGSTLLLTALYPCSNCAKLIIQAGIKRVIAPKLSANTRWDEEANFASLLLTEAGVRVELY